MTTTVLRNNLRVHRLARGESLAQTAAAVGIDRTNLSKIERGQRGCPTELALRFSQHFGVSVAALFFAETVDSESPEWRNQQRSQ